MSEFIRAEGLYFSYPSEDKEIPALRGVSVSIKAGEYVAILGHNGSGKSTFAKLLNMILTPTRGRLFVAGEELTSEAFDEEALFRLRSKVGMVFQNPDNQLVASVVEEDVAFGCENLGIPYDEMHARVDEALERVGLTRRAKHQPTELSGGQQQRVAIARALVTRPSLILADEPTGNLDSKTSREIMDMFHEMHEQGNTIVLITHDNDVAHQAKRIVHILDGKLTEVSL